MHRTFLVLAFGLAAGLVTAKGDAHVVQKFFGTASAAATPTFKVEDKWEVLWLAPTPTSVTVIGADGTVAAGGKAIFNGALFIPKGGTYYIQLNSKFSTPSPWNIVIAEVGAGTTLKQGEVDTVFTMPNGDPYAPPASILPPGTQNQLSPADASGGTSSNPFDHQTVAQTNAASNPSTPPTPPAAPAPIVKLTEDQARAVVLIKGDNAEGTGFMIKTPDGPAIITNIHVIANNPNLKITTNTGALVTVLSEKGASDRDLAMLSIKDFGYNYLEVATDISQVVQPGDEVITPGNSQGGEVMLNTAGKVLGIGPLRIEIDNPIYHGNSGGPVFHTKSGKVLGVVTEAIKVDVSNDLDKASFASRNSAISNSMRYFGLRLDTVSEWVPIDSRQFQIETTFLDQFHDQSRRLDSYLNSPENATDEESELYLSDEKIMDAINDYRQQGTGGDTGQHLEALRTFLFDLQCVADLNMQQIQNSNNFYTFDRERAVDELSYRKALKDELDSIGNNIDRLGHLPRTNN
jgi:Trypsin-like peptidase domain